MQVGFIGLGALGKTMARRLIEQGIALVVWNRTRAKGEDLGAEIAESPAEVLARADTVILNLFDSDAVAAVLRGPQGLLSIDGTGKTIIDTTTNHFTPVVGFHREVRARGGTYLEAPVAGSVIPASQGKLAILVSGEEEAFERARPLLAKLGSSLFYLGSPGRATRMKLVNNLVLGSFMATLAEAVNFGEAIGLERERVLEVLAAGAGNSGVLAAKMGKLREEDFSPHFSAAAIYKDLHFLQDLARELGRPLYTGAIVKELFGRAFAAGREREDFSVVYALLKEAP